MTHLSLAHVDQGVWQAELSRSGVQDDQRLAQLRPASAPAVVPQFHRFLQLGFQRDCCVWFADSDLHEPVFSENQRNWHENESGLDSYCL